MAESNTEIANLALGHIGIGYQIGTLDTEKSAEARSCRRHFTQVTKELLRLFAWPFSTKYATCGLVQSNPNDEWGSSNRLPADCLGVRRVVTGIRNDTRQSVIAFKEVFDATGGLILCDQQEPTIEYTALIVLYQFWPPDFVEAHSRMLAARIAPELYPHDGETLALGQLKYAQVAINRAMAAADQDSQPDEPPRSEFERERNT